MKLSEVEPERVERVGKKKTEAKMARAMIEK